MKIVCLDLEGVLVPEIWIEFARESGISQLTRTTRDEPNYDTLMKWRIDILNQHGMTLTDIQNTISKIQPLSGAKAFLDTLRQLTQVVIVSDTFTQFAKPLMSKLGWPAIFCNELIVNEENRIIDYRMRCQESKLTTVKHLQGMGFQTIAVGDSFNDLGMILHSKAGFLFRTTQSIKDTYPQLPSYETYDELLEAIKKEL